MTLRLTGYSAIRSNTLWQNEHALFTASDNILTEAPVYLKSDYPKFYKMDNLCKTAFIAFEALPANSSLKAFKPEEIALVIATADGCIDTDIKFEKTSRETASPALFVYTLPNIMVGELSIRFALKGESACFVSNTFDIDFLSAYVERIFQQGNTKICLLGWVNYEAKHSEAFFCSIEPDVEFNDIPLSQKIKSTYNSIWKS